MHIPDGYLAPQVALALGVVTVPVLAASSQKVKKVLNNRTVPLLAIFSALSFTVMMFNVPVPGGIPAVVLFVRDVHELVRSTRRQLTYFDPAR